MKYKGYSDFSDFQLSKMGFCKKYQRMSFLQKKKQNLRLFIHQK